MPCTFGSPTVDVQPAPALLKFQARISQSKLPIGEGTFFRVVAKLRRGTQTLCTETFNNVVVKGGTVNLEIGRNLGCELDQVVAENDSLDFQLCVGGSDSCLRPVALGTVPAATKASFAVLASLARRADVAGQANYAHRVTADADVLRRQELGVGFFDFHTPAGAPLLYSNAAEFSAYAKGGFLQWTPSQETRPTLHLSSRKEATAQLQKLDKLVFASLATTLGGRLQVRSRGVQVTGTSLLDGATSVTGRLRVSARPDGSASSVTVAGDATFTGPVQAAQGGFGTTLLAGGGLDVLSGGLSAGGELRITGRSTGNGPLVVGGGGLSVVGSSALAGSFAANGALDVSGTLTAGSVDATTLAATNAIVGAGGAVIDGALTVNGTVSLPSNVRASGVAGAFQVPGTVSAGALRSTSLTLTNGSDFSGNVARPGPTGTIAGELTVGGAADSGLLRLSGGGDASGSPKAWIDLSGASANAALDRAITMNVGGVELVKLQNGTVTVNGNLAVSGTLNAAGAATGAPRYYFSTDCTADDPLTVYALDSRIKYPAGAWCKCNPGDIALNLIGAGRQYTYNEIGNGPGTNAMHAYCMAPTQQTSSFYLDGGFTDCGARPRLYSTCNGCPWLGTYGQSLRVLCVGY